MMKSKLHYFRILILLSALLTCYGCAIQQTLTRKVAARLIRSSKLFNTPYEFTIFVGDICSICNEGEQGCSWISILKSAKLIDVKRENDCTKVELTEAGARRFRKDNLYREYNGVTIYQVPIGKKELIAITSIYTSKTKNYANQNFNYTNKNFYARVEYDWELAPNELGKLFLNDPNYSYLAETYSTYEEFYLHNSWYYQTWYLPEDDTSFEPREIK